MLINNPYRLNNYNRESAVQYALTYALDPNPNFRYFPVHGDGGGDCSNFISQCLKAGGAPFAYGKDPWWYNRNNTSNTNAHTWSISWAVAHSLYWTLKIRGQNNMKGLRSREVESIDMLDLGDIIQYENFNGMIYHSAMITAFTEQDGNRLPLISQHTYNAKNIPYVKPAARKAHFMKIEVV